MTFHIDWDQGAIKQILRDQPIENYMLEIGHSIASAIEDDSRDHRTGDNSPRHIKGKKAINPGHGYSHYQDSVEVFLGMDAGMAAVYVIGTRHSMTQEYGWRDYHTGLKHEGRFYMTLALLDHEVK